MACGVCFVASARYKCPGCGVATCLVPCVRRHKEASGCSGKVDVTAFRLRNDLTLEAVQRDYNFLQSAARAVEVGKRVGEASSRTNKRQKGALGVVVRRGVRVAELPAGMSRSSRNLSGYDKKRGTYMWTVEWCVGSQETEPPLGLLVVEVNRSVVLVQRVFTRVGEDTKVKDGVPWDKLEAGHSAPRFYLKEHSVTSHTPYTEIDGEAPLSLVVAGKTVLEFPTVWIATSPWSLPYPGEEFPVAAVPTPLPSTFSSTSGAPSP